ncbi:MAG TPA: restriction endonuclease subunit S [Zoogloea sp.]|uniref:restriction endonuclease subunit S n=1 Tax=Zoogloea sp. TaxID=49181 RepID=UPI002BAB3BCB|nr:restriction endonuclease subunit S [Zoogloea sp.]HMW53228.1 restriction endonuclease subunit S [Rhodocyclaceae bacterium]HMY50957.1 restriction endonuclease subunit S [Rhodocyclaceae bacterium]HNB65663.1 restriction endonuclease subunit S [Rhodocyclaceae bacterium]HNC80211.1 restriction endonuclease subunit S [Rhodocyclaceae bacterium]HNF62850.1 restriction endonuclease subunit S [Rhodocyclaceae bacterium]
MTVVRLGTVCSQVRESIKPGERAALRYVGMESIESGTGRFLEGGLSKTPESPLANSFRFGPEHVLYGKLRPYLNKVALPDFEGKCSTEIVPLKVNATVDRRYLAYFLRCPDVVRVISDKTAGSRMPRADMAFVLSLPFLLRDLSEQSRIVDLLTRAESILRLRREAEKKTAELVPALFLQMFGDPVTNPKGWRQHLFSEVGVLDRGRSRHRPRDAAELYGGPYPFIQTGDVSNSGGTISSCVNTYSEQGLSQSKLWAPGTLCITIAANIARTAVLNISACFPDSVVGFVAGDMVCTRYVQTWLDFLQPTLEMHAPQAAQKNINLEILRNLPISVPPKNLQEAFVFRFETLRALQSQQAAATAQAQASFDALLARAFAA